MRSRTLLALPALAFAAISLAACGGGSSSGGTVPADADLVVRAVDPLSWAESEYSATAGDVVVALQNDSSLPHNLHIVAEDGSESPAVLSANSRGAVDSATVALTAGTYTLICTVPGHTNMRATLTVS